MPRDRQAQGAVVDRPVGIALPVMADLDGVAVHVSPQNGRDGREKNKKSDTTETF